LVEIMEPLNSPRARRFLDSLERLTDHFWLLLGLLLLINALVLPYRGLFHDARLYAAQVKDRLEPGSLSDDLFLRYGSQDRYSAFSLLMLPLGRVLGLEPAFFLGYLASKVLFFAALIRLVLLLVPDRPAALASLVYLAMAPLPWGGNEVFHLNEPFLTPRLAACAMVLLALERAMLGRPLQSVFCQAGAFLLHPLMAFVGALVLVLWGLGRVLSLRRFLLLGALGALAASVVVFYRPLGVRVFGYMDDEWRQINFMTCFFLDPGVWTWGDWMRIGCAFLVTGVAAFTFASRQASFLGALLGAAVLGLIGNLIAVQSPYLLLIQASPYRTLWLLELLAIPLAFWGGSFLWQQGTSLGRLTCAVLLLWVTADWNWGPMSPLWVFAMLLAGCALIYRGLAWTPRTPDWIGRGAGTALLVTAGLLLLYNCWFVAGALAVQFTEPGPHPLLVAQAAGYIVYKLPLVVVFLALLAWAGSHPGRWGLLGSVFAFWLGYQGLIAWADASPWYADHFSGTGRQIQFVKDQIRQSSPAEHPPSVFWTAELQDVWFRAGVQCYFNTVQLSGTAFNRGTAIEGRRRALLVRRFAGHHLYKDPIPSWWQKAYLGLFNMSEDQLPTEEDLLALAAEEGLDFVVVEQRFPGLYRATDGRLYFYDCRELRARGQAANQGPCQSQPAPRSGRAG
jgi:hypothetical protein